MSLLLPSEALEFSSRKALEEALQSHAKENGYAITVQRSNIKDGAIYYRYDREGKYKPDRSLYEFNRRRDTGSRRIDCPFSIRANVKDKTWTIKIRNADHNHDATSAIAHPIQHCPPLEIANQIETLTTTGSALKEIVAAIRQATDHPIVSNDVYNIRKLLKARNLAGKTPIEALITQLSTSNYISSCKTDSAGCVSHLFFANPRSVELFQQYPDILLLDCTYNTNRFKMPLLVIVGTTCLNTTFYIAFCFLPKETEEDYTWALEHMKMLYLPNTKTGVIVTDRELALTYAIRVVFPGTTHLLYAFHVENNVKSHTAEAFGKGKPEDIMAFVAAWKAVIYSPTLAKYDDNWNALQDTYNTHIPAVVQYMKETWLDLWKYFLVHAYVDRHLHLGTRTTSRVEGAHATLKKYLQVSTEDLKLVFDKISLLLTSQHAKYDADIARNKTITPHTA
jgi:hypothetical protein